MAHHILAQFLLNLLENKNASLLQSDTLIPVSSRIQFINAFFEVWCNNIADSALMSSAFLDSITSELGTSQTYGISIFRQIYCPFLES